MVRCCDSAVSAFRKEMVPEARSALLEIYNDSQAGYALRNRESL